MHDPFQPPQQRPGIPHARGPAGQGLYVPPMPWMAPPSYGPPPTHGPPLRSNGTRGLMLAGLIVAYVLAVVGIAVVVSVALSALWVAADPTFGDLATTDAEYEALGGAAMSVTMLLVMAGSFGAFVLIAPKVSYRRLDTLFLLVPVYGYVFIVKMLWRLTALPARPWPLRPDEYAAMNPWGAQQWGPQQWGPPPVPAGWVPPQR